MTTPNEPPMNTVRLAELIGQRHDRLSNLFYLSQRQIDLIHAGDFGLLMKVLSSKQRLLGELQTIERGLDPFRGQSPEEREWVNPAERADCARKADEGNRLLGEIFQIEQRAGALLAERRDRAAAGLQQLHTAHEACGAYLAAPDAPHFHRLDLTTEV
jgi:hypothetical protein